MGSTKNNKDRAELSVPAFYKRKIFIIVMIILCSGIIAVLSTYAWFILSTAPEIRGVSTTVGANGSLEVALLDETTGANLSLIESDVGDSIYVVGPLRGNITWGNLVDLSNPEYGLSSIVLYPALMNKKDDLLDILSPLATAKMGKDGRITKLSANTVTSKYKEGIFRADGGKYGVRGIGTVGNGTTRELALVAAKNSFIASISSAKTAAQQSVVQHGAIFASVALANTGDFSVTLQKSHVEGLRTMSIELTNSLEYILNAYKQAIIARAASNGDLSPGNFESVRTAVLASDAAGLSAYVSNFPDGMGISDVTKLGQAISDASVAGELANTLLYDNYGTENQSPKPADTEYTVDQISAIVDLICDESELSISDIEGTSLTINSQKGEGILTTIADFVGNYSASIQTATLYVETSENDGAGKHKSIQISSLVVPSQIAGDIGESTDVVTNFYGYAIDLAFRTNVAADLRLQTVPVDRIYTDGAGATMGSGSNVTYTFAPGTTEEQVKAIYKAIRIVFFDPDTGYIFSSAVATEPVVSDSTAKAAIVLENDTSGNGRLLALEKAVPRKLSALVYLSGSDIDNTAVVNAENSGTIVLNLQFSSSAELHPMVDNDLKNSTGD